MKFRRVWLDGSAQPVAQVLDGEAWRAARGPLPDGCADAAWEQRRANDAGEAALPFQPKSFRDFMLYERHVVDATRGYVRRFMPGAYRAASAYERLTGGTFPSGCQTARKTR